MKKVFSFVCASAKRRKISSLRKFGRLIKGLASIAMFYLRRTNLFGGNVYINKYREFFVTYKVQQLRFRQICVIF